MTPLVGVGFFRHECPHSDSKVREDASVLVKRNSSETFCCCKQSSFGWSPFILCRVVGLALGVYLFIHPQTSVAPSPRPAAVLGRGTGPHPLEPTAVNSAARGVNECIAGAGAGESRKGRLP